MLSSQKFSILLVDDDPLVIRVLNSILSDFSPIRFATSGHAALELARADIPDLVLLDVEMPELSGFEVCKAFKSDPALREVPIIYITGHESEHLETVGIQLGGADFIRKPPNAALLLARVRTYQKMKTLSDTVRSAVTMDFLTGAVTRRRLERALNQEWLRAQRSAEPLSLLLLDIHDFKAYETEFGEENADECLRSVADVLRSVAQRPTDLLGRWDGGTFALLLPGTPAKGAGILARRAGHAVDALRLQRRISLSVGGSCLDFAHSRAATNPVPGGPAATPVANPLPENVIAAAGLALANAKAAGRGEAVFIDISAIVSRDPAPA